MKLLLALVVLFSVSCSSISPHQKSEIAEWKAEGVYQETKDPTTAALLNILPGFGNFYIGEIGYGIGNLLLWPLSILWAPVGASDGALLVNYSDTKIFVAAQERKAKREAEATESKKPSKR